MADMAASVLARLKNKAKESGSIYIDPFTGESVKKNKK